jgi:hypothetical protein
VTQGPSRNRISKENQIGDRIVCAIINERILKEEIEKDEAEFDYLKSHLNLKKKG